MLVCIWRNKHSYILLGSLNCSLGISLAIAVIIKICILFDVAITIEDILLYRNKSNYKNMELLLPKTLALWKKNYDKPRQHVKKQRHYFANKCRYSQSYGFPSSHVWICVLDNKEGWACRISDFEPWCWRRLLKVPWTARRSNQSILKELSPE